MYMMSWAGGLGAACTLLGFAQLATVALSYPLVRFLKRAATQHRLNTVYASKPLPPEPAQPSNHYDMPPGPGGGGEAGEWQGDWVESTANDWTGSGVRGRGTGLPRRGGETSSTSPGARPGPSRSHSLQLELEPQIGRDNLSGAGRARRVDSVKGGGLEYPAEMAGLLRSCHSLAASQAGDTTDSNSDDSEAESVNRPARPGGILSAAQRLASATNSLCEAASKNTKLLSSDESSSEPKPAQQASSRQRQQRRPASGEGCRSGQRVRSRSRVDHVEEQEHGAGFEFDQRAWQMTKQEQHQALSQLSELLSSDESTVEEVEEVESGGRQKDRTQGSRWVGTRTQVAFQQADCEIEVKGPQRAGKRAWQGTEQAQGVGAGLGSAGWEQFRQQARRNESFRQAVDGSRSGGGRKLRLPRELRRSLEELHEGFISLGGGAVGSASRAGSTAASRAGSTTASRAGSTTASRAGSLTSLVSTGRPSVRPARSRPDLLGRGGAGVERLARGLSPRRPRKPPADRQQRSRSREILDKDRSEGKQNRSIAGEFVDFYLGRKKT